MNTKWTTLASEETIEKTKSALIGNGFEVIVATDREDAKQKTLALIPEGAEIMTMTSITLKDLGIADEINTSGKYDSVRNKLNSMDHATQGREMKKLGAAPDYAIGSVTALTQDGHAIIASNTGSQLPAYAYGASHVIFVVGSQKIVPNNDEGIKRAYEHALPLESVRAHEAYGVPGSSINKMLIFDTENTKGRVTIVIVPENLGY
jgi:acyl-CoA hydrolase